MLQRAPIARLQPYIESVWASARAAAECGGQEITLPNQNASIVMRLDGTSLDLIRQDNSVRSVGQAVIGGVQTRAFTKNRNCASAVGAVLKPGALPSLMGANAVEFTDDHIPLDAVLHRTVIQSTIEMLQEVSALEARLCMFEAFLLTLLPSRVALHPVVQGALQGLHRESRIGDLVAASGISHRHFNHLFTLGVGVSPKYYQRLLRVNFGISALASHPAMRWSDVALGSGYADQPHFNREFRALTGLTPTIYARSHRRAPLHVVC